MVQNGYACCSTAPIAAAEALMLMVVTLATGWASEVWAYPMAPGIELSCPSRVLVVGSSQMRTGEAGIRSFVWQLSEDSGGSAWPRTFVSKVFRVPDVEARATMVIGRFAPPSCL